MKSAAKTMLRSPFLLMVMAGVGAVLLGFGSLLALINPEGSRVPTFIFWLAGLLTEIVTFVFAVKSRAPSRVYILLVLLTFLTGGSAVLILVWTYAGSFVRVPMGV